MSVRHRVQKLEEQMAARLRDLAGCDLCRPGGDGGQLTRAEVAVFRAGRCPHCARELPVLRMTICIASRPGDYYLLPAYTTGERVVYTLAGPLEGATAG